MREFHRHSGFRRAIRPLALASGLFLALSSAAMAQVVFHRGNDGDPETLDSHKTSTVSEAHLLRDLSEGLVIHHINGEVVPGVAESWTVAADGKSYTFRLRANAKWSNGDPVTAGDFVFSFRRMVNPETGAKYANILYPIRNAEKINKAGEGASLEDLGVRAVDERTLEITLERPTPYFLELLTHQTGLPVHPASVQKFGKEFVKPENWVSNGAYVLKEFVPNSHIRLEKNKAFHDAASVQIDTVLYYPSPDLAAAARRFIAGELHMTTDIPADQIQQLREKLGKEQVKVAPYLGTYFLIVNTAKKPFDDIRVRRALSLVIDREFIADEIWSGTMLPAYGVIPPNIGNYGERAEADFKGPPRSTARRRQRDCSPPPASDQACRCASSCVTTPPTTTGALRSPLPSNGRRSASRPASSTRTARRISPCCATAATSTSPAMAGSETIPIRKTSCSCSRATMPASTPASTTTPNSTL